jgi:hypothetical protein
VTFISQKLVSSNFMKTLKKVSSQQWKDFLISNSLKSHDLSFKPADVISNNANEFLKQLRIIQRLLFKILQFAHLHTKFIKLQSWITLTVGHGRMRFLCLKIDLCLLYMNWYSFGWAGVAKSSCVNFCKGCLGSYLTGVLGHFQSR